MKFSIALCLLLLTFVSPSFASGETPKEALQVIIDLYKSSDFDTLIRKRYAEIHKAKSDGDINKLIARHTKRFSNKKLLGKAIQFYESALRSTPRIITNKNPQITETDKMAEFPLDKNVYKLYLLKTGVWGFHM